jgi:hypothetical protein
MSKNLLIKSLDELHDLCQPTKCGVCQAVFEDSAIVCSDCYFEAFAEEIEKYPIGTPRSPRITQK